MPQRTSRLVYRLCMKPQPNGAHLTPIVTPRSRPFPNPARRVIPLHTLIPHAVLGVKLFRRIVRAEYRPLGNSMYSERLSNLVAHLLMPDPAVRPPITMVSHI